MPRNRHHDFAFCKFMRVPELEYLPCLFCNGKRHLKEVCGKKYNMYRAIPTYTVNDWMAILPSHILKENDSLCEKLNGQFFPNTNFSYDLRTDHFSSARWMQMIFYKRIREYPITMENILGCFVHDRNTLNTAICGIIGSCQGNLQSWHQDIVKSSGFVDFIESTKQPVVHRLKQESLIDAIAQKFIGLTKSQ
jgi:hypothetical protein